MVSNGHGVTKRAEVHLITKVPGDERFERKRRAAASGSFLCDSHSPLRIQCLRENSGGRSPAWQASPVARAGARREPPGSSVRRLWGALGGSERRLAFPLLLWSPPPAQGAAAGAALSQAAVPADPLAAWCALRHLAASGGVVSAGYRRGPFRAWKTFCFNIRFCNIEKHLKQRLKTF